MHIPIEIQDLIFEFVESENRIYFKKNVMRELNLWNGGNNYQIFTKYDKYRKMGIKYYSSVYSLKFRIEHQLMQEYYKLYGPSEFYLSDFYIYNPISY